MSPENDDSLQKRIEEWQKTYDRPAVVVADLLCDRHTGDSPGLIYEDAIGREETYTYARLLELSSRFAAVLKTLGVSRGDRVATLLPKSPALVVATLGLWRLGAAHVPRGDGGRPRKSHRHRRSKTQFRRVGRSES